MAFRHCLPLRLTEDDKEQSNRMPCGQELTSLRRVFDACDENSDGFLSLEELCEWMKKLGLHLTRQGLREIVQSCDRNLDGRLDFDEFLTLSASLDSPSHTDLDHAVPSPKSDGSDGACKEDADLREAFLVFDKDCNGLISPSELKSTLSQLGLLAAATPLSRIESMIRRVDTDGDGEVNFSEFQNMMKECI